jgi:hypothetical protein
MQLSKKKKFIIVGASVMFVIEMVLLTYFVGIT